MESICKYLVVCVHFLGSKENLSEGTLLRVAKFFTDETACQKLAALLGDPGGPDFIDELKRKRPRITPKVITFKVMQQWQKEEGENATWEELIQVLNEDFGWTDVAAELATLRQQRECSVKCQL